MTLTIPPVLLWLLCAVAMRLLAWLPEWGLLPRSITLIAVLAVAGAGIVVVAVIAFYRAGTTVNPLSPQQAASVVRSGIYRCSRNPMYLGMALLLAAWALWLAHVAAWAGVAAFVLYLNHFQIRPEEAALTAKFGDAYREYCRRTRRWL